mmetsp:Transcript_108645/g.306250  ORF Transcript_108645/g.306250 Transcript_108645/m.306250 type:complete len:207 (+) Transcript_108645:138-758(+)
MYGLRGINNIYEGGSRSDFVVVGHPEYCLGRIRSSKGLGKDWDVTQVPAYPKRSAAADRLRRSGSTQILVKRLTNPPHTSPRDRALAKTSQGVKMDHETDYRADFNKFLDALRSQENMPTFRAPDRVIAGSGNHIGSSGTCRHYELVREELADLADKLRRDPAGTERQLLVSDSWRYYATRLEQARRRQRQSQKAASHLHPGPRIV